MRISLLLTGDELMSGDTVDSNSAYIAQSLKDLGLTPRIKKVVGDDLGLLTDSITELSSHSDVLIVNGGLGPTVDDLTALALSKATGSELVRNQFAMAHLTSWAAPRGFVVTESNLKQADLPAICDIIDNPVGSAVGFRCEWQGCMIICTPGVPSEFKKMVEDQVLPIIKSHAGIKESIKITRLRLFGVTESGLQDIVNEKFPDWPIEVELGFRVQMPVIEVKFTSRGEQYNELNRQWSENFASLFSDYIIGRNSTRLSQALNDALAANNKKIVTAESCTGGSIASSIVSEAGSSFVFDGGFVVYSNAMKESVLGVPSPILNEYGAVSEHVVLAMAKGALERSDASIAISISGIAGPAGGTHDKPVGTVWMAWGEKDSLKARRFLLPMPRLAFQRTATSIAMDLVRREIMGLSTDVDYFSELKRKRHGR